MRTWAVCCYKVQFVLSGLGDIVPHGQVTLMDGQGGKNNLEAQNLTSPSSLRTLVAIHSGHGTQWQHKFENDEEGPSVAITSSKS